MNKFGEDIAYQSFLNERPLLESLTKLENESTTRLRAIDTFFFDILAWDKKHVETEKYCRHEGYADYVFFINDSPYFVLEAKKSGIEFLISDREFEDRPYVFALLAKECPDAMNALQQAIGYATTLGAGYVGVSNGHQWLFTLTFIQDQPLERRLVYVFESLDSISNRFSRFCKCFGQEGLKKIEVCRELLDILKQPAPEKISSMIPGYPISASRNIFQNELSYILDYVWQIMAQDEGTIAFVENCYVNPRSHEDIIALVRELLVKRKNDDDCLREYEIESVDKLPHELAHLPQEKPFIVLGEVGRGKTSFLKYLRYIAVKELLRNYLQIEINFIDRPDTAEEIPKFVYSEIERQLRENYSIDIYEDKFVRGVLHGDIQRLKKTSRGVYYSSDIQKYREIELEEIEKITSDKHLYFTKLIHHLKKGRSCSIAIFFDNLDRREEKIQEQAFLNASAIARDWSSLVFICLRPATYYRSQRNGVLDTIAPKAFTVGQPELPLVLKKRFSFARQIAEGVVVDKINIRSVPSRNISFDLPQVAKIFESCEFSAWKRHGIIPMLEAVSNGNIRRLLDFAKLILCSGHLDTKKILNKISESGTYFIPDFEGVKTLLYGDYMHYDPSKSPFINLFDIQKADPNEHFLRLAILNYLAKISTDSETRGYVNMSYLTNYLATQGYSYSVAFDTIKILTEKHCIRKAVNIENESAHDDKIRITTLGKYQIYSLASEFQYLYAMTIDTPIINHELRNRFYDTTNIIERLDQTQLFVEYLNKNAELIKDEEIKLHWMNISTKAMENIIEIRGRINTINKE